MKKRINELLNEKFEYAQDRICFSDDRLECTVRPGKAVRGKMTVRSGRGEVFRGFLSSSDARLKLKPAMFVSRQETVIWEFDASGLTGGAVVEGEITACTTAGEGRLPFRIRTEQEENKETVLPDVGLTDFAKMAREDFSRAYVLFASEGFGALADTWGGGARALYEGICGHSVNYHSLEQFLVGMGQKLPVTLRLNTDHVLLQNPEEDTREELLLTKEVWGFAPVEITCGEEFLTIERQKVTTEEFVGSIYNIGYMIHKDRLHTGRNFARIRICCECREIFCDVEVRVSDRLTGHNMARSRRQEILQMMNSYISWRCKRTGDKEWAAITISCLDNYHKAGGSHIFYDLYRIYVLFLTGEQVEAAMLLQEITARKEELAVPRWKGFYLYLTTMENTDAEYVEYVKEEVNSLFLANQEDWVLQWMMFRINGHLFRGDSERLDAVRRQYICGCTSPVMYLEAWEILKREPLMLRTLGAFEVHLLKFLCREDLLDLEICGQAAQLAARVPDFSRLLYEVLCRCYEKYPSKNMLTAICALLMKGHKSAPEYGKWFELGTQQDVRLAGLYEYYALTATDLNIKELPRQVRMYFSYNNTLDYEKKAAIYANIIRNRGKDPETYKACRPDMELFMEQQLQEGRISTDLALLFEELLTRFVLNKEMTEGLSRALFTYEVTCRHPRIHHVVAVHRELCQEQRVMLSDGKALVQLYCGNYSLLLEDGEGVRYADPSMFEIRRLLDEPAFEEFCREAAEPPYGIVIHDCFRESRLMPDENNAGRYIRLMNMPQIRPDLRILIQRQLLDFFSLHPALEETDEYLKYADCEKLCQDGKALLMELLVSCGKCREAFDLIKRHGAENVGKETLVRLCSWKVKEMQAAQETEEDDLLTSLCMECFEAGLYDEAVLDYLLCFYEGPVEVMKRIWQAGSGFLMENYDFEEKVLALVLFMRSGQEGTEKIFGSYWKKQGKSWLCRAYVIWMSYCYFVREEKIGQIVFDYIENSMCGEMNMPEVCQLALLRRFSDMKQLSPGQQKWLVRFMEKFTSEGMRFRFFEKFPAKFLRRFHLHDKFFVEYRTDPGNHVTMHYTLNEGKECSVSLTHVYQGIFVREFTLFYLDKLEWYLTVEKKEGTEETEKRMFVCQRRSSRGTTGQYELLNRLTEVQQVGDEKQIQQIKEQYIGQQYFVDEFFGIN